MPSVKRIETKKKGSRYTRIYDSPKTPLTRLYEVNNNKSEIKRLIDLKNNTNPFDLISKINKKLEIIWENRSKKIIKDTNYLNQKEILENVKKLLKKEVSYGNINYDKTIL